MALKKIAAAVLTGALLLTGLPSVQFNVAQAEENSREDGSVQYAVVASADKFRDYIDDDGVYASQDFIETAWNGYTDVHKIVLEEPGTLYLAALARNNYVEMFLYGNSSLTAQVGEVTKTKVSDREQLAVYDVEAGTYYYRGSRWNGSDVPFVVTVYAGFVPDDPGYLKTADNQYDGTDIGAVPVNEIPVAEDLLGLEEYIMGDGIYASQDIITDDWSGTSVVHSFTVGQDGWLFAYPLCESGYVDWKLFSNKDMTSCIADGRTRPTIGEKAPVAAYLKAGTYYFCGERWNGTGVLEFTTYLGFMPASSKISVQGIDYSSDGSAAVVTFNCDPGLKISSDTIAVAEGTVYPCGLTDSSVWTVPGVVGSSEGASITIKKNGDYTVRVAGLDDNYYCMAYFSVDGISQAGSSVVENPQEVNRPAPPMVTVARRGKKTVKGTSGAYSEITVKVAGRKYTTVSNGKGKWSVKINRKLKKGNVVKAYVTNSQSVKSKTVVYKVK